MIETFLSTFSHPFISSHFRRSHISRRRLREVREMPRCRTTGQKGTAPRILIIEVHDIRSLELDNKRTMPFIVDGSRFPFSLKFSPVDLDNRVLDHRQEFPFFVFLRIPSFFLPTGFFAEDF